jgi:hypothetical protein
MRDWLPNERKILRLLTAGALAFVGLVRLGLVLELINVRFGYSDLPWYLMALTVVFYLVLGRTRRFMP